MTTKALAAAASTKLLGPVAAVLLALGLLYLAGFSGIEALHDGAHDARHSAGMPCH